MCPNHLLYGVLAMVHATLKLQGISCAACAHNIETAMQLVAGVSEGSVNYGAEQASVTYDPRTTSLPQIQAAIADAGYGAYPLQDTNPLVADDVKITTRRAEQRVLRRKVWVSGIHQRHLDDRRTTHDDGTTSTADPRRVTPSLGATCASHSGAVLVWPAQIAPTPGKRLSATAAESNFLRWLGSRDETG